MATQPEQTFYKWINTNFRWFFQRIETTTASGVPDIWACHKGFSIWIETKATNATNVQLRKSQYAWMAKAQYNGWPTWVWNRSPRRTTVIQAWRTPFEVEPGRKDHVKIISQPTIVLPAEQFAKLDIAHFVRHP